MAPDAVNVRIVGEYMLRVTFDTGETKDFDVRPLLDRQCYAALTNAALFRTVHVLYGVVTWANGTDIDPDWLYADSRSVEDDMDAIVAENLATWHALAE